MRVGDCPRLCYAAPLNSQFDITPSCINNDSELVQNTGSRKTNVCGNPPVSLKSLKS